MINKKTIYNAATVILAFCALITTMLVMDRVFFGTQIEQKEQIVENWQEIEYAGDKGKFPEAKIQILKFFDYQCPWCKQSQAVIDSIYRSFKNEVNIRYVHFPSLNHEQAFEAAIASECARNQGVFESYHKLLFAHQNELAFTTYESLTKQTGVKDLKRFTNCLVNSVPTNVVQNGINLAEILKINVIPSYLMNISLHIDPPISL
ncbi:MAG: DsbA family protein [Balneolaceae bacterium]